MKSGEKCRLVHRYAITPFQFRYIHESNNLKKTFTYKDKQNHLRLSSVVYKLTCTCASNYIGQTRRNFITESTNTNLINVLKFANICWPIPSTVLTSSNRKYWEVLRKTSLLKRSGQHNEQKRRHQMHVTRLVHAPHQHVSSSVS